MYLQSLDFLIVRIAGTRNIVVADSLSRLLMLSHKSDNRLSEHDPYADWHMCAIMDVLFADDAPSILLANNIFEDFDRSTTWK